MENAARLIIIISGALARELGEVPEAVIRAGHDDVGRRHGVQERRAVGAVAVGVCAGDLGGLGLQVLDIVVDGADFGFVRGGLEPCGEVVGSAAGGGVCGGGHGDGVCDTGLEGGGLGAGAGGVGYGALLNAGCEGLGALVRDVLSREVVNNVVVEVGEGSVLSCSALVWGDIDGVGLEIRTGGKTLHGGRGGFSNGVLEALDGGHLGVLDALELVALGCVDRDGDGLASGDFLETVCRETLLLVVDEHTLERQSVPTCAIVRLYLHTEFRMNILASATNKSLVAWSLKTVLPLNT